MADTATTQGTEDDVFTFESAANKEYPLAPEGVHKVTVVRALYQLRDNTFDKNGGKQHVVQLMLRSTQQYKDEATQEMKNYNLFRTMKISDHPQSGMYEFFQSVLGIDVPLNAEKKIILQRKIEKVEDGDDRIHMPQFENLDFSVVVKHEVSKETGKKRDRVDSIVPCNPQEKAANAALFQAPEA